MNIQVDLNLHSRIYLLIGFAMHQLTGPNLNVCGVGLGANAMHDVIRDFVFSDVMFTFVVQK